MTERWKKTEKKSTPSNRHNSNGAQQQRREEAKTDPELLNEFSPLLGAVPNGTNSRSSRSSISEEVDHIISSNRPTAAHEALGAMMYRQGMHRLKDTPSSGTPRIHAGAMVPESLTMIQQLLDPSVVSNLDETGQKVSGLLSTELQGTYR